METGIFFSPLLIIHNLWSGACSITSTVLSSKLSRTDFCISRLVKANLWSRGNGAMNGTIEIWWKRFTRVLKFGYSTRLANHLFRDMVISSYVFLSMSVSRLLQTLLTGRVWGPYCQLRTEFFPLQFIGRVGSTRAINWSGKKQGAVTYSTVRVNAISKMLLNLLEIELSWEAHHVVKRSVL